LNEDKITKRELSELFFSLAIIFLFLAVASWFFGIPSHYEITSYPFRNYTFGMVVCFIVCLVIGAHFGRLKK